MSSENSAQAINLNLHRLPLVLEILNEIHESNGTWPGDKEIRHGAIQAVRVMIQNLKRIVPAQNSNLQNPPSDAEMIAREWLRGELPGTLLPGELHQDLSKLLQNLIPKHKHQPKNRKCPQKPAD